MLQDQAVIDGFGEFLSGTTAGIVSKFVDFPFDTVKTRLQVENSPYKGATDCIKRIAREEGLTGFYRGIPAPIGGAAFENAGAFLFYGRGVALYRRVFSVPEAVPTPFPGIVAAGGFAGIATGTVLTPVELLKCRVQNDQREAATQHRPLKYKGIIHCGVTTVRTEGFRALFNGYSATLCREIPGNAAWFGFYELTLKWFTAEGKTKDDCAWYAYPISGGVGGFWYWTAFYPADTVKTRMQLDSKYQQMGLFRGIANMCKEGGVSALYSGYGITVCRAFPANATIFATFEFTHKWWKKKFGAKKTTE